MARTDNVVLVHGAWADGSSWAKVIPGLLAQGLRVTAVQLPLSSLEDDVATVKRALALLDGPAALVGHSYGGVVITEAGNDPKVSSLVYVTGFAPDAGESALTLLQSVPPTPLATEFGPDAAGFLKLTHTGMFDCFAQDLDLVEKQILFATQAPTAGRCLGTPVTQPAWKHRPTWYVQATEDRAIAPALQATMARRAGATVSSATASHVAMLAKPSEVVEAIVAAVR